MAGGDFLGGIFGGGGGKRRQQQQMQMPNLTPAVIAPPPDRSDAEIQREAEAQRKRYGVAGGRTVTNFTGGLGVPQSSIYTAAANLLGGT